MSSSTTQPQEHCLHMASLGSQISSQILPSSPSLHAAVQWLRHRQMVELRCSKAQSKGFGIGGGLGSTVAECRVGAPDYLRTDWVPQAWISIPAERFCKHQASQRLAHFLYMSYCCFQMLGGRCSSGTSRPNPWCGQSVAMCTYM